ncbi:unnamed protein product [Mytilus coruscus]|uniref:C3H1-type domain-containing protein n=1 Tax=Mytilus coruscus TaxID=42192 RepID=A0A6J8AZF6_MYTCO|nr:unnamed protein product [Mytilus coruscus]
MNLLYIILFVLPFYICSPNHTIRKRSQLSEIFFSKDWRTLYDYYKERCSSDTPSQVMKWTEECILVCDEDGIPLFLDRRGNPYDLGLGTFNLEHGPGHTRSPIDTNLYLGDSCPDGFAAESIISFNHTNHRNDPFVIVCNETHKAEFLSLRFSRCPSGVDFEPVPEVPTFEVQGADCFKTIGNTTDVDLAHNTFTSYTLAGTRYQLCGYRYCCNGVLRMLSGSCDLGDFCDRLH